MNILIKLFNAIKLPKQVNLLFTSSSVVLILVIIIPIVIMNYGSVAVAKENTPSIPEQISINKESDFINVNGNSIIKVYLTKEDKIVEIPLEEYVTSVVSGEMLASFEDEALKAQSIAARTYVVAKKINKCSDSKGADVCDSTHCQVYIDKKKRLDSWGEDLGNEYWSKIENAVKSTVGEVLTYNGDLVMYPQFFSTSSGETENSVDVFSSDIPYLRSTDSPGEEIAPKYTSTIPINIQDLLDKINNKYPNAKLTKDNLATDIKILSRSESGGVKEIQIGNEKIKGSEFRLLLNLNSTNFEYEITDSQINFKCKGYGHGVGMSQWGANIMAKEKKSYQDILSHYYTGVKIKKLEFE